MEPVTTISGAVTVLDRADVDTDQIIPKQFLKRIERTGFGEFLFYDWVRSGEVSLAPNPILATGRNFGCGSSREHAVWAIQQFGFAAVVAPSFSDIFWSNATKNGLLPVALDEADVRTLMEAGRARIDLASQTVSFADRTATFDIDPEIKRRLLGGLDDIAITLTHDADIADFEAQASHPAPSTAGLERGRDAS
ncbi:MAG TPA: 3-isopropylmalate dehydratase small subunit [Actinomycetota bacterium]|nr:3-isopropylmalate dehydratase small subunit [Actinomycetota bacterium]